MRLEAERGCQLCNILQLGPGREADGQPGDHEVLKMRGPPRYDPFGVKRFPSVLTFLRDTHDTVPFRAEFYPMHFGFSLVPYPWCKSRVYLRQFGRDYITIYPIYNRKWKVSYPTDGFPSLARLKPIQMEEHVENLPLIEVWLENCRDNHARCSSSTGGFFPTRLLDLQAFSDCDDIRLVNAEELDFDGPPPKYVTLSHCWGPPSKHSITTTKATLRERMMRIPFTALSQTFQDSVKISRSLKQRFLWIDSLCIIQDDEDDWASEAALMALVYSHSYFTLAALSSRDDTEGCKMVTDVQSSYSNRFVDIDFYDHGPANDTTWSPRQRARIFEAPVEIDEIHNSVDDGPLNDRAWTLQERELSRRVISFSKRGLLWECAELRATSQRPWAHVEKMGRCQQRTV